MNPELVMLAKMERDRNPLPKPSCEKCRFFAKDSYQFEDEPTVGKCRRRAPDRDGWPGVNATVWCGEYERNP